MSAWEKLRHLFERDDGSLPDIFVEGLSGEEVVAAYEWLTARSRAEEAATVWSVTEKEDIPIREVPRPAYELCIGNIESFRHQLQGLSALGVQLPLLTVFVMQNEISFDYRMGPGWNERSVEALFEILRNLRMIAPRAKITRTEEGGDGEPDEEFRIAFDAYAKAFDA